MQTKRWKVAKKLAENLEKSIDKLHNLYYNT